MPHHRNNDSALDTEGESSFIQLLPIGITDVDFVGNYSDFITLFCSFHFSVVIESM